MLQNERAYAEVNIDNFKHNLNTIKSYIGNKTKLMAVLKANAYGLGALELLPYLNETNVDYIGVATYGEAMEIRNKTDIPILILSYTPKACFKNTIEHNIETTIYDIKTAYDLSETAQKINKIAFAQIKINSGLNRIGFNIDEQLHPTLEKIKSLPNIIITGIFTHFSMADNTESATTNNQFNKFMSIIKQIDTKDIIVHCANSASTINYKETHLDMVRCGGLIYGQSVPLNKINIKELLTIKAAIININTVSKGEAVGYGSGYVAKNKTKVATIAFGYGDGYARVLSNKGRVIINDTYANIIGNICMDQFFVDVTHIKNISEGAFAMLVGKSETKSITLKEIASQINSIEYEISCRIKGRVPRIYIENNYITKIVR